MFWTNVLLIFIAGLVLFIALRIGDGLESIRRILMASADKNLKELAELRAKLDALGDRTGPR